MRKLTLLGALFSSAILLFGQGPAPRQAVNLDDVFAQYDLSGENVLVIMIDRGIDYEHPDFIDAEGNTRIAYAYDMIDDSGANDPDNPYGVGTIFDRTEIDNALDNDLPHLTNDRFGHGTATTSIACGNGFGSIGGQFMGVAPRATIISIKITHDPFPAFGDQPGQAGFFNPGLIGTALEFAEDKIEELGLPSVTLMNIGSIGGPTDGTSTVSRQIDDFIAAGHTFVCGVGDDGGSDNYAAGTVEAGQTTELLVDKGETGFLRLDLWYAESDRFTVSIERPNGTVEGPFTAPASSTAAADQNLGDIFIGHRGAEVEFFGAASDRRELLIDFSGDAGQYKILLQGAQISSGEFQATLNPSTYFNNNAFASHVVSGHSINDYASTALNITPGDYVIDNSWTAMDGNTYDIVGQGETGELWIGSSTGPTQDGRQGIDFVTPGEVCYGAYSPNTWYSNASSNIIQGSNGLYGIQNAVSAAAPLSIGIIALMLEVNPDLTPSEIKELLQQSCIADSFTGAVPNNTWGYGKLDALLAIQNTVNFTDVQEPDLPASSVRAFPNPFRENLQIRGEESALTFRQVEVYNQLGQAVWRSTVDGSPTIDLPLGFLPAGMYSLILHTEEGRVVKQIIKGEGVE